jgi:hypothetical protein
MPEKPENPYEPGTMDWYGHEETTPGNPYIHLPYSVGWGAWEDKNNSADASGEVVRPGVPAGHFDRPVSEMAQGEGFHHEGQSWVAKSIRSHDRGITVVAEPRAGFVGRNVVSQLQFGVKGITTEDTNERAFTFQPDQQIPFRG